MYGVLRTLLRNVLQCAYKKKFACIGRCVSIKKDVCLLKRESELWSFNSVAKIISRLNICNSDSLVTFFLVNNLEAEDLINYIIIFL
jgi:hypothetical protein